MQKAKCAKLESGIFPLNVELHRNFVSFCLHAAFTGNHAVCYLVGQTWMMPEVAINI